VTTREQIEAAVDLHADHAGRDDERDLRREAECKKRLMSLVDAVFAERDKARAMNGAAQKVLDDAQAVAFERDAAIARAEAAEKELGDLVNDMNRPPASLLRDVTTLRQQRNIAVAAKVAAEAQVSEAAAQVCVLRAELLKWRHFQPGAGQADPRPSSTDAVLADTAAAAREHDAELVRPWREALSHVVLANHSITLSCDGCRRAAILIDPNPSAKEGA
jgi:hypothetical protein